MARDKLILLHLMHWWLNISSGIVLMKILVSGLKLWRILFITESIWKLIHLCLDHSLVLTLLL